MEKQNKTRPAKRPQRCGVVLGPLASLTRGNAPPSLEHFVPHCPVWPIKQAECSR